MAHVDDRRVVVGRPRLGDPVEGHRCLGDAALVGGAGGAERGSRLDAGVGRAVEAEGARDPDRAELLREALQPAAGEREVAVDPDERARRHLLAVEQRVDDDERLLVLRARGIQQLAAGLRARLPVGEDERAAARVWVRVKAGGQARDGLLGVGPELDDEEVADVVPRRVRNERRAPFGRARDRVAPERHYATSSSGGSTWPRVSRLSRSYSIATGSKRKYERGGSGPQVFDE